MAEFIKDLWESIFTPGPTPSLLIATNVSFAALQVVLFALLLATYSVHFVVLSGLCGGLWWAINWFAREVKEAQRLEQLEKEKQRQAPSALSSSDDETEVETTAPAPRPRKTPTAAAAAATTTQANPEETKGELKHRAASTPVTGPSASAASTKSGMSTEDEWEKVSESEEKEQ
ncbi:hypothetical protein MCOR25_009237 [Pyricularia grisea]|uniref:Uncharacterized protein n=1 Tax=Pyricularia grisea TaxID=148305 RepID=A0A6P8B8H9_PYRGI|nr:uncharacterized protein PgNI_04722 [Pyricularia grisea]KAI6352976.1 hypothetical protein MCOR25_009237 [Pyricularia grisea]TLD12159.1 hypothetical protein PgNI_04722 [Pyricularia grisea]